MTTKEVQEYLCIAGFKVKVDAINGPATQAALKAFQQQHDLEPTGIADNATAYLLAYPITLAAYVSAIKASTFAEAVSAVAKHYLAFHPIEIGGQNRGPWVRHFMHGMEGDAYPWCAGTVSTILEKAHTIVKGNPFTYTMSCDRLADQAKGKGLLTASPAGLAPGAIFLIRGKTPGDWVHTGIVTAFNADHYVTIEGNTNDDGGREGWEMCSRIRAYKNVDFVRL